MDWPSTARYVCIKVNLKIVVETLLTVLVKYNKSNLLILEQSQVTN